MADIYEAAKKFLQQHVHNQKPRRFHSCAKELSIDNFENKIQTIDRKPKGIWYGYGSEDTWLDWCIAEQYGGIHQYIYEIVMHEDSILKIQSIEEFEKFENEHYATPKWQKELNIGGLANGIFAALEIQMRNRFGSDDILASLYPDRDQYPNQYRLHFDNMNYAKVAENYGGIEVTPYIWEKRLDSMWYYGWDCASGCVWHRDAIKEIQLFAFFDGKKNEFVKTSLQLDKTRV